MRSTLKTWGLVYKPDFERVSRVDYAIDFRVYGFALDHTRFVNPARMGIAHHLEGTRTTSVTLGKMPGAQIIVYDKSKEVADKGATKATWWRIWQDNMASAHIPPLNRQDPEDRIWRVELRAGKNQLRNRWHIRTIADLQEKLPSMLARMAARTRYCQPNNDSNRARWPNHTLWDGVQRHLADSFWHESQTLDPPTAKAIHGESHAKMLENQILGSISSYAFCIGFTPGTALAHLTRRANQDMDAMAKRMENARRRYILL